MVDKKINAPSNNFFNFIGQKFRFGIRITQNFRLMPPYDNTEKTPGEVVVMEDDEAIKGIEEKIINCHTHIFTADHVPPYLAKTYVPVVYGLLNLRWIVSIFRWWYRGPGKKEYTPSGKISARRRYNTKMYIQRHWYLQLLMLLVGTALLVYTFYFIWSFLGNPKTTEGIAGRINQFRDFVNNGHQRLPLDNVMLNILITLLFMILFKSGRNLLLFLLRKTTNFFAMLPGPKTKELFQRYLNIGRFSFHDTQSATLTQLCNQYPPGTKFVVLPMDMDNMNAGKPVEGYMEQMAKLLKLKKTGERKDQLLPFIFADPGRLEDRTYFSYDINEEGKVVLSDCHINTYLKNGFCGFKIYPALGYYPFDEGTTGDFDRI